MSRLRSVALTVVATCAIGAVLTSTAFAAQPEFKPVPTKAGFTSTSGTSVLTAGNVTITCSSDTNTGKITGAHTVTVTVTFKGCKGKTGSGSSCAVESKGGGTETIVTKELKGELGNVAESEAKSKVGLDLKPVTGSIFTELAKSTCTAETKVTGSVAGEVKPVGVKQGSGELVLGVTSKKQNIKLIESLSPELVAFSETATEETTDKITYEEALEVT